MAGIRFYDGLRPMPRAAQATLGETVLHLRDAAGATLADWPLDELRGRLDTGPAGDLLLFLPGASARALLPDPDLKAALLDRCPDLLRPVRSPRLVRRTAVLGAGTLAAVALMVFVLLPVLANRLAPLIPADREAEFGRVVVAQVVELFGVDDPERPFCEDPRGAAALGGLVQRLLAAAPLPYPEITVQVVDGGLVNAFAAPGGQVVIFRGLIEEAAHPDEVAGVLAHELGHVATRDPTRLALRAAGTAGLLGLLFGDFTGATVILALGDRLIAAAYTREAEAAADRFALRMLEGAAISPAGMAAFFDRLSEKAGNLPGVAAMLQTHPDLARRAEEARAAGDWAALPAMTPAEWQALRAICR